MLTSTLHPVALLGALPHATDTAGDVPVDYYTDWDTWVPWTIAVLAFLACAAVYVVGIVFANRMRDAGHVVGLGAIVPAIFATWTLSTIVAHFPSGKSLVWVFVVGVIVLGATFALSSVGGRIASGAGIVFLVVTVSSDVFRRAAAATHLPEGQFGTLLIGLVVLAVLYALSRR